MRAKVLVGVMAGAMAIMCADASAATYCVPAHSGCTGTPEPTLADALSETNLKADVDDIVLAPGHFAVSPGVTAQPGRPVDITGAGINQTFIDGTDAGGFDPYTLALHGMDQRISDLTVRGTGAGQSSTLNLDGATAERVRADQRDNGDPYTTAVQVRNGATFLDGEALGPLMSAGPPEGVLIDAGAGQTSTVANSLVQGYDAVY